MTLKLPKMAASMRDGTLVEWLVKCGDMVRVGQSLYIVETEKTSAEIESPFEGVITIVAEIGQNYPVGTPIAEIQT